MSKELADRLETVHTYLANRGVDNLTPIISEAIAALLSEPVADSITRRRKEWEALEIALQAYLRDYEYGDEGYVPTDNEKYMLNDFWNGALSNEAIILALRHVYPIRKLYAAPSREQDRRESNSNPAPVHGQSKTGLTGSHPGAPTPTASPARLSAEEIEHERESYKNGYGVNDAAFYKLCDMALSALTARDEGIEAAAIMNDVLVYASYLPFTLRQRLREYLSRGHG